MFKQFAILFTAATLVSVGAYAEETIGETFQDINEQAALAECGCKKKKEKKADEKIALNDSESVEIEHSLACKGCE